MVTAYSLEFDLEKNEVKSEDLAIKAHHTLQTVSSLEATCTEEGNIAYYECDRCHKYYSDEDATHELSLSEVYVAALGHNLTLHVAHDASCTENGNTVYYECDICHNQKKIQYQV